MHVRMLLFAGCLAAVIALSAVLLPMLAGSVGVPLPMPRTTTVGR